MSEPIDQEAYLTVRQLFARGLNQEVIEFSRQLPTPWPEGVTFYVVAALINLDQSMLARQHLARALSSVSDDEKADLTVLEGLLQSHQGDDESYYRKAVAATKLRATAHTMYHLGLASADPRARLRALQASLIAAEEVGDTYAEARNAAALATAYTDMGSFKKALGWLQFARDRTAHPGLTLIIVNVQAYLQILTGSLEGLEEELVKADEAVDNSVYPRQKIQLRSTLADLYQATERYDDALRVYQQELAQAPRALRSWLTHGYVRALRALNRPEEAQRQAEATLSVTDSLSEYHQQRAQLALGISLWPSEEAVDYLLSAHRFFASKGRDSLLATESALYLGPLDVQDDSARTSIGTAIDNVKTLLTLTGIRLLAGPAFSDSQAMLKSVRSLRLFTLGRAELYRQGSPVTARSRSLELLTLLALRPSGYDAEALSEALYGELQTASLRVELHRLRKEVGVEVSSRPYRLTSPVWSDVAELETYLGQGKFYDAIKMYRGPLLPQSTAPEIVHLRGFLETELHAAVINSGNLEAIWELAQIMPFDLELWEELTQRFPAEDPRRSVAAGRRARVRLELDI